VSKRTIGSRSRDDHRGYDKASLLKIAAIALALGVVTWLLAPILLPVRVPQDFPKLPDLQTANPSVRALLESADQEARQRPGSAEAVAKLGMAYHANLFFEQARQAYRIAAREAPRDYQWAYCQAFLQEESGNEKEEFRLLQETVRLKRDYIPALLKLGDGFFKLDKLDEAAHYYETASKASNGLSLQASFGLGRVAARRQEWNRVIEYIAPLLQTYSYVQQLHQLLQEAYDKLGQADRAAEERQGVLLARWKVVPPPEDPLNEQLIRLCYSSTRLLKQAGLLSHLGYPDRAIRVARRAAEADPADPDVRSFIARTLLTFYGNNPEAINEALTQLGECLRLRPDDVVPLWMFANDFFDTPKPPGAVERLRVLMRPYANRADAHFYLGLVADARGDAEEAASQYQAALKHDPGNSSVYDKLGLLLDRAARIDGAIAYLNKAVQLNPMNITARFNLGVAQLQKGNNGEALQELDEVLRLKPDHAAAHFVMGFALLDHKRTDEAIAKFREGLRFKPDQADAHYGLGSALSMQGKREAAVAELREALRLRPSYPEAQALLHQLGN